MTYQPKNKKNHIFTFNPRHLSVKDWKAKYHHNTTHEDLFKLLIMLTFKNDLQPQMLSIKDLRAKSRVMTPLMKHFPEGTANKILQFWSSTY